MILGPFERCFHEGSLWRGHRAAMSFIFTKQKFVHLFFHWDWFYNRYINSKVKNKYLYDDGMGVKPPPPPPQKN